LSGQYAGLQLSRGELRKQSYVRLGHVYQVPIAMLRGYSGRAYKVRFCYDSYKTLVAALGIPEEPYPNQDTLWETATYRLEALATSQTKAWQLRHREGLEQSSQCVLKPASSPEASRYLMLSQPATPKTNPRLDNFSRSSNLRTYGSVSERQQLPSTHYGSLPLHNPPNQSPYESPDEDSKGYFFLSLTLVLAAGCLIYWYYLRK
jgi:hypothetical protein